MFECFKHTATQLQSGSWYTDMVAAARTMSGFMQRRKRKNQMEVCTSSVEQKDKMKAMALHGLPSSCKAYEQAVDKLVEGLHDYSTTKDT